MQTYDEFFQLNYIIQEYKNNRIANDNNEQQLVMPLAKIILKLSLLLCNAIKWLNILISYSFFEFGQALFKEKSAFVCKVSAFSNMKVAGPLCSGP
jgi:hypothetical protein